MLQALNLDCRNTSTNHNNNQLRFKVTNNTKGTLSGKGIGLLSLKVSP